MNAKWLLGCGIAAVAVLSSGPASAQQVSFNIPAGPLPAAIAAFGRQSGLQIVAPGDGFERVRSNEVRGRMNSRAAIRRLIEGTGLEIASEGGGQIVLRRVQHPVAPPARTSQTAPSPTSDPEVAPPEEIVVTGLRASLQTAREIKRKSDAVVDVVAAEDVNQLPDNSATEALSRLPGVQVLRFRGEAQGFTVRGLPQVLTTVNGQESYYGTSRQSLLNSYPASLIASAEVYKALTPDLIEGGIGGAVNINFRKPFDYKQGITVAGTLRGTYEDQDRQFNYNGDILLNGRWDTGIGELGFLVNASYLRRDYLESYRQNQLPGAATRVPASPAGLPTGLIVPQGILIRHNEGNYRRPVLTAAAQWRPTPNLDIDARVTHVIDRNEYTDNYLATTVALNTVFSDVTVVPGTNIVKGATFTASGARGPYASHTKLDIETTQIDAGATWQSGIAKLSTRAVYTDSTNTAYVQNIQLNFKKAPTIRAEFQSDARYGGLGYDYVGVDMTDPNNFILGSYADALTRNKGGGFQWRTDLELETGPGFFRNVKAGFRYAERSAHYRATGTRSAALAALNLPLSAIPGGETPAQVEAGFRGDDATVPASWVGFDGSLLGDTSTTAAINRYLSAMPAFAASFANRYPAFNPLTSFDGKEVSYAAYGQFKYDLSLAGVPIDGVIGARIVNTTLAIDGTRQRTSRVGSGPLVVVLEPVHSRQNYVDVDPSVSAVAHFTRNLQLRATWTKTFTRPDFSQLNPSMTLIEQTIGSNYAGVATTGNPDLQPIRSKNLDASLEWYFGRAGAMSVAGFKRDIQGFIVNTREDDFVEGSPGLVAITRPINAGKGTIKGFELSASTFFDFAPGILRNFGASANFTYAESNQTLPLTPVNLVKTDGPIAGVSKTSLNAAVFYDDRRLRIRVAYSTREKFLLAYNTINRNYDQYYYPLERLDFSIGYKFAPGISLTVDGTNLLNIPQHGYYGMPEFVDRVYYEGRTFSAALRFTF